MNQSVSSRLLVLDGHSLAFRAFYALPADKLITSTGQHTNAVYGFISMLTNLWKEEQPTHMLCAFDQSGPTFRHHAFAEYKAQREATPETFIGQIELIKEVLIALGITYYSTADYEADDIIASTVTLAQKQHFQSAVVTGDRDAFQLINSFTTVLYPKIGTSHMLRFTPQELQAHYGLTPEQYPDYAALRGDKSDNLPSVPKVGEKTAIKWIQEYGSLTELIAHADQLKGAVGQSFRDHIEQVEKNRYLTQMITDVPLPFTLNDLIIGKWDVHKVHEICDVLEIGKLRQRLIDTLGMKEVSSSDHINKPHYTFTDVDIAEGQLEQWLDTYARGNDLDHAPVCEVIGSLQVQKPSAQAIIIATENNEVWSTYFHQLSPTDSQALASWLCDDNCKKITFNSKGTAHALAHEGYTLQGVAMDIELAAYLLQPDRKGYKIEDLVSLYTNKNLFPPDSDSQQMQLDLDAQVEVHDVGTNTKMRAVAMRELSTIFTRELIDKHEFSLLTDMELPVQKVLGEMERVGIAVDTSYLHDLCQQFSVMVDNAASAARQYVGEEINLNSPKQLQTILFDTLHMPKTKKIKTGYTTDADALVWLYEQTNHPFLQYLLEYRDAQKLKTSVEGLLSAVSADGRIHSTFNQITAATGRLSSTDPNLQNIHVRTPAGKMIRSAFITGEGYECLLTADYSQIEMRIMAHVSQDAGLIHAFQSGEDLHSYVGSQAFGVPLADVTPELRRRVKAMSYGLSYGLSAHGLAQQLKISFKEAEEHMERYFARFGNVRDYLHNVVNQARQTGYTQTLYGRKRYFPELLSQQRQRREIAERAALNSSIQGTAADIIKTAMIAVVHAFEENSLQSRLLLQVHDELIIEIAPGEKALVTEIVKEKMSTVISLDVPLDVSLGFGYSWNDAAHDA